VEFLSNENERLTSALVSSREEISRLSSLVGGAAVVGVVGGGGGTQPVAMNVNLGGGGGKVGVQARGGGYGY
jgi:ATF/CREB family transcription factor